MIIQILKILIYASFINSYINLIGAIQTGPLYRSACTLLQNKIYCFFGGSLVNEAFSSLTPKKNSYSLSLDGIFDNDTVRANWSSVVDKTGYVTDGSIGSTIVSVNDTTCLIDGGINYVSKTVNLTKAFNVETNRFSTVPSTNRNLNDPIYLGTAVLSKKQNKVYYWGGLVGGLPGYPVSYLSILDLNENVWTKSESLLSDISSRFGHTATLDKDGRYIYYIGGKIRYPNAQLGSTKKVGELVNILEILIYDTWGSTWKAQNASCESGIYNRYLHTATLIPNSNTIVVYGGADDQGDEMAPQVVNDPFYYFDISTFVFSRRKMNNEDFSPGPRFGHSAIIYKESTLFIMYGFDVNRDLSDQVYFLNLDNSSWLSAYPHPFPAKQAIIKDRSLDAKAIIGISIGSVLVIMLLIIGIIYTLYMKAKKSKQVNTNYTSEIDPTLPQLHKEYKRFSTATSLLEDSMADAPVFVDISSESGTIHDSTTPPQGFNSSVHKPNQPLDQPPNFSEQYYNASNSSLQLSPVKNIPNNSSQLFIVKPSLP